MPGRGSPGIRIERIPPERVPQIELMPHLALRNPMHGLLTVDVTAPRRRMRHHRERTGDRLSFTAFIIACLARAVDRHPHVQGFRRGRRVVVFDEVDIATLVEVGTDRGPVPLPYVVRDAAARSVEEITGEIRAVQADPATLLARLRRQVRALLLLPRPLRWLLWRLLARSPRLFRRFGGTVVVTSLGMFGSGRAWGLGVVSYPVTVTVGAIDSGRGPHDTGPAEREQVCLTVSLDHEVVDGAPAARFVAELQRLIEDGYGLPEPAPARQPAGSSGRVSTAEVDA